MVGGVVVVVVEGVVSAVVAVAVAVVGCSSVVPVTMMVSSSGSSCCVSFVVSVSLSAALRGRRRGLGMSGMVGSPDPWCRRLAGRSTSLALAFSRETSVTLGSCLGTRLTRGFVGG